MDGSRIAFWIDTRKLSGGIEQHIEEESTTVKGYCVVAACTRQVLRLVVLDHLHMKYFTEVSFFIVCFMFEVKSKKTMIFRSLIWETAKKETQRAIGGEKAGEKRVVMMEL